MPIFDCTCKNCGAKQKDVVLKINHSPSDVPMCECGERMTKDWARANGIFKGSGFHATDYHAPTRGY